MQSSLSNQLADLLAENVKQAAEIVHLRDLLEESAAIITLSAQKIVIEHVSNEEVICLEQLALLRQVSAARELTHEECRKVDTYVKVLGLIKARSEKPGLEHKDKSIDELLEDLKHV